MRKNLRGITVILIAVLCLVNTGCTENPKNEMVKSWQELVRLLPENQKTAAPEEELPAAETITLGESIDVKLYFVSADGAGLEAEMRTIPKTEGLARQTLQELIKGPKNKNLSSPLPAGVELLDINIKPEGLCIIDLNSQAQKVDDEKQEQMMVYALVNTVGQFPAVQEVTFMINGEKIHQLGGYMDLSAPIEPDYSL